MLLLQCYFFNVTPIRLYAYTHTPIRIYAYMHTFLLSGVLYRGRHGRFFFQLPRLVLMRPHRHLANGVVVHIGIYRVSFSWPMLPWLF